MSIGVGLVRGTRMPQPVTTRARSRLAARISGAWSRAVRRRLRAAAPGSAVGPYTLDAKIGEGAMGVVYKGRHTLLGRPVAIKLLSPERSGDDDRARFEREAQLTSSLTHPNTISVYDSALSEAHGRGLVHRDIKPANAMVCERGGVSDVLKLLDFTAFARTAQLAA
jgi:serine/threonine-protein kinase